MPAPPLPRSRASFVTGRRAGGTAASNPYRARAAFAWPETSFHRVRRGGAAIRTRPAAPTSARNPPHLAGAGLLPLGLNRQRRPPKMVAAARWPTGRERLQRHGVKTHAQPTHGRPPEEPRHRPRQHSRQQRRPVPAPTSTRHLAGLDGASLHIEETLFILDRGTGQPTGPSWQGAAATSSAARLLHNDTVATSRKLLTGSSSGWADARQPSRRAPRAAPLPDLANRDRVAVMTDHRRTGILPSPYGARGHQPVAYRSAPRPCTSRTPGPSSPLTRWITRQLSSI